EFGTRVARDLARLHDVHVVEHEVSDLARQRLRVAVVHEERAVSHPVRLPGEYSHRVPADRAAVYAHLIEPIHKGTADVAHRVQVRARPDQCLAAAAPTGEDL